MLDHVFISVSDIARSIDFYTAALAPLGITTRVDYDGSDGPPGHPDLYGFGADGRIFFWLRSGVVDGRAAHVGFVADGTADVDAAYAAAMAAGATDNGPPSARSPARMNFDSSAVTRLSFTPFGCFWYGVRAIESGTWW